jgi:large-conductance mechanosensitive channel
MVESELKAMKQRASQVNISSFGEYLNELNILGLALGFLTGQHAIDIGKALGDDVITPLIIAATGSLNGKVSVPSIAFGKVFRQLILFVITMLVIYLVVSVMGIKVTKPVQFVRVVNTDEF